MIRATLAVVAAASLAATPIHPPSAEAAYPTVVPGIRFAFPADHGAHPAFRTEWWYVTGWLKGADGRDLGFQVTFFRVNPHSGAGNPSRFAPRQVIFAHAALSDTKVGRILHVERAARAGFGLAGAATGDADVRLKGWTFRRMGDGRFTSHVGGAMFSLDLGFRPTQRPLAQGLEGYSRKGPKAEQASYYYSLPHLAVSGTITRGGRPERVTGEAWLDREWSSNYLAPDAAGWDWTGLNLDDGSALMAFRIRRKGGGAALWAGGSYRRPDGRIVRLSPGDVAFKTTSTWRSARTRARYPVGQTLSVRLPEGVRSFPLRPMFADQEVDARAAGQPVYWEGAVRTTGGRGYLELTGYAADLRM